MSGRSLRVKERRREHSPQSEVRVQVSSAKGEGCCETQREEDVDVTKAEVRQDIEGNVLVDLRLFTDEVFTT